MKSAGEIMEILEAFDLTGSYRDAGELAGCSHHTVARYVAEREAGGAVDRPAARPRLIEGFLPKVEEWVDHSGGKIRADKVHGRTNPQAGRRAILVSQDSVALRGEREMPRRGGAQTQD